MLLQMKQHPTKPSSDDNTVVNIVRTQFLCDGIAVAWLSLAFQSAIRTFPEVFSKYSTHKLCRQNNYSANKVFVR